ncbi:class I SAM-dependent methyltransferase [Synergistaceae bacterium OttesenSCG-928-D05]|nr:class I SAM-dependent methyltransferase [Synergistaceae bacterium OttesenSCG-928-D05]
MKENKYDDEIFFEKYNGMERSKKGLAGAGEWPALQKLMPDFTGKRVLDLGCGFGWHCRYAVEQGAASVIGVDLSKNMLREAKRMTDSPKIEYLLMPVEDIDFSANSFDVVISSLTFHYVKSFQAICEKISACLTTRGHFIFSVEHPVFTAYGSQDWHYGDKGEKQHWPVDRYFNEGPRNASFLGEEIVKYHKTLTTYLNDLLQTGFMINAIIEPQPEQAMLDAIPDMRDELRRPMMLIVAAQKQ